MDARFNLTMTWGWGGLRMSRRFTGRRGRVGERTGRRTGRDWGDPTGTDLYPDREGDRTLEVTPVRVP